ncbi:MAG: amidohydrolase family protein [Bacteriovoracaceae bacterium]|nr:amidohydrolase family protein [Bacteriovoracaceae bacterium]
MDNLPLYKCFLGTIINPVNDRHCNIVRKGGLVLKRGKNSDYKVSFIGKAQEALKLVQRREDHVIHDYGQKILMPGFFDMHFHWVQDDVRLMPKDNLLTWLSKYTWPYESKFKSKKFSKNKAKQFSRELLQVGTLGGAVYASIHPHSVSDALESFVGNYTIGNVLMTMNSPDYLTMSEKKSLSSVEELSSKYKSSYCLTPRFAPTTSPYVMSEGRKISKKYNSFVQTHLSETKNEIEYVLSLYKNIKSFEKVDSYLDIYDKCGLLSSKTIMGHAIHLTPKEWKRMSTSKTNIAHCPTSNAPLKEKGLGSGLFDFKKADRMGVNWALASDIGGGPFLSMFDVMRSFVDQNKRKKVTGATWIRALYRSTLAGAKMLTLSKEYGNLDVGKFGNFLILPEVKFKKGESKNDFLKRAFHRPLKRREEYSNFVLETWYKGKKVYSKLI